MYLSQDALDYVLSAKDELMDLERTLCAIPSPSHQAATSLFSKSMIFFSGEIFICVGY